MKPWQYASVVFLFIILHASFSRLISASAATSKELKGNYGEAFALFKWKTSLDNQSQSSLSSWEITDSNLTNHCGSWFGITCNKAGRVHNITIQSYGLNGMLNDLNFSSLHHLTTFDLLNNSLYGTIPSKIGSLWRLTYLVLAFNSFSGKIPSSVGNLSNLTIFYLYENKLAGEIPREIGLLKSLTELDFSKNNLLGSIPSSIGNLSNLTLLNLWGNELFGEIPREIGLLKSLTKLVLSNNNLSGSIPSSMGNLSSLTILYLYENKLVGEIPREIGLLKSLTDLALYDNNLSGFIPSCIGNLSSLKLIYLYENKLVGEIPREIGLLKSLTKLDISNNSLSGSIPNSIGNLSNLTLLNLMGNQLGGPLPISLNNLTKIVKFIISYNHITGQLPHNICIGGYLTYFSASNNNITGQVPKTLKSCTSLRRVRLDMNHLTGNLSEAFGVYPHLNYIDLSYNNLKGELSQNWGSCRNLSALKISNNNISGRIPTEIGWLQNLQKLDLSSNYLTGEVPKRWGKLLLDIYLSNNKLSGSIPLEMGDLTNLVNLDLAENNLSGFFPSKLAQCWKLLSLNVSKNRLDGDIPSEIGNLKYLEILDLAQNLLSGEIPQQVGLLATLESLNLSHNRLSGSIPHTFSGMVSLISVDLSYNQLEGPIPNNKVFASFDAFKENKDLCGNITDIKACLVNVRDDAKNKRTVTLVIVLTLSFSFSILVLIGLLVCRRNHRKQTSERQGGNNDKVFSIWSYDGKLVYENIIDKTENFDEKYCIGMGGSGAVYKVELPGGQVYAVKKLHTTVEHGELNSQKAFTSEIRALAEIRHRNVIKFYGFCSHTRHSFLVYEFLEGGALQEILRDANKATAFEWTKRVDIIKGVANGLSYMHHDCSPPIVHRDISSKNILLDEEYVAHISDFGTARILKTTSTNCTSFAGTFGYAAPELAYTMEVNEMQDVYSFGVLTLEVLMGRHPGDLVSSHFTSASSLSATTTEDDLKHTLLKDILDPRLRFPIQSHESEEIVCSLKLAFSCLQVDPHNRPTMKKVSTELSKQRKPLQNSLFTMTLGQLFDPDYFPQGPALDQGETSSKFSLNDDIRLGLDARRARNRSA